MKKIVILVCMIYTGMVYAQTPINDSIYLDKEEREKYLVELFQKAEIVSFTQEKLSTDNLFLKKVNVKFTDTTFFFTAVVYSAFCTTNQYLFSTCEGVFIELHDGGIGAGIDGNELKELPELKKVIDDIVNKK